MKEHNSGNQSQERKQEDTPPPLDTEDEAGKHEEARDNSERIAETQERHPDTHRAFGRSCNNTFQKPKLTTAGRSYLPLLLRSRHSSTWCLLAGLCGKYIPVRQTLTSFANAAKSAAETASRSLIEEQKPIVGIQSLVVGNLDKPGKDVVVIAHAMNTGRSTAISVVGGVRIYVGPGACSSKDWDYSIPPQEQTNLFSMTPLYIADLRGRPFHVSAEYAKKWRDGVVPACVYGFITYQGGFGDWHCTDFCSLHVPPSGTVPVGFSPCPFHTQPTNNKCSE